jgi:hypothetical protein
MIKLRTIFLLLIIGLVADAQTKDELRIKYNNPDLIVDLGGGLWGTPLPVDYDNDGLIDILLSCPDTPYKGVYFHKNIGTLNEPLFDIPVKLADVAYQSTKASFVNDSLKVIRNGVEYQNFTVELFGSPKKIEVDVLPEKGFKKTRSKMWSYVDYDNDGDQDILVGIGDWTDYGWDDAYNENGVWTNGPLRGFVFLLENQDGKYINQGKRFAGDKPIETYGAPGPNMADFDKDGKPDIICGEFIDKLTWFKNIGTRTKPKFAEGRFLTDINSNIIKMHLEMITPVAIDFDKDGDVDLLVGDEDGRVAWVKNTGKVQNDMPVFENPVYLKQKADNLKFGALSTPFGTDWDNDGDEDIIAGNSAGNICYFQNLTGGTSPKWAASELLKTNGKEIRIMAGKNGSIQGPAEEKWGYITLSVADWDLDGKNDLIVNSIFGKILWYRNTGDLTNLEGPFAVKVDWAGNKPPKPEWNWWNPKQNELVSQWRTTPFAIDWNKDGLTDLVMMDHEGYLSFFQRFKKGSELFLYPGKRIFYVKGNDGPNKDVDEKGDLTEEKLFRLTTGRAGKSGRVKFCLVDWNKDGRIDVLANSKNAVYYENIRQNGDTVIFEKKQDVSNVELARHTTSPSVVDWDNDGISELLLGAEDGHFYLLQNGTIKKIK